MNNFTYCKEAEHKLNRLDKQIEVEHLPISLSDASSQPWAVMIKSRNAMITVFAVLASEWLLDVAHCAVFGLNE